MSSRVSRLVWYVPFLVALAAPTVIGFALHAERKTPEKPAAGNFAVTNQSQRPEPATGAISGVVLDGSSGEAVPGAVVFLAVTPARRLGSLPRQITDERGRFVFANLPGDAAYTISATKFGYLDGGYGRDTMPADPLRSIALKADQWIPNIKISIWKPGAISGVVRDESGEPVVGVVVRALGRVRIEGRDEFLAGPITRTDDRGVYRISKLEPGKYILQVPSVQASVPAATALAVNRQELVPDDVVDVDDSNRLIIGNYPLPPPPANGRQMSYPVIFHASTSVVAQATSIDLKYGEDRSGIDLILRPVASVRVSGIVEGPQEALQNLTLRLLPVGLENLGFGAEAATALASPDGRFTFLNVPAGSYTIDAPVNVSELSTSRFQPGPGRAFPVPPNSPGWGASIGTIDVIPGVTFTNYNYRFVSAPYSGRVSLTVGSADVTGVVVRMRPFATISGRVIVERDPAQPNVTPPNRFAIQLDTAAGEASLGRPGRGGRGGGAPDQFIVRDVIPGLYWLRIPDSPGWLVKSVLWKGRDYATMPLDTTTSDSLTDIVVTVTNAVPELTGSVRDTEGLKADATMVIAFPVDQAAWKNTGFWPSHVKTATVTSANTYRFNTLPAGEYLVAAISRSFANMWRDPEFLARVARSASRVTLTWAGKSSQDLTVMVIR